MDMKAAHVLPKTSKGAPEERDVSSSRGWHSVEENKVNRSTANETDDIFSLRK